jgi:hypothetical protein
MALWCVGFAVVNIVLESTDYLADSEYADYASAFTVMNWLVVGLKLMGAAVALLSVTKRPPFLHPRLLGVMVWSVFATLTVYVLGGMAQALGMVLGLIGSASQIDLAGVAYLIFFLMAATAGRAGSLLLGAAHPRLEDSSARRTRSPHRAGASPGGHADPAGGSRAHARVVT